MVNTVHDTSDASAGDSTQPAKAAKQIVAKHVTSLVKKLFSNLDDNLFDYANKAGNNDQQEHYFSAMRDMRKDQKNIQLKFLSNLDKLYDDSVQGISFNDSTSNNESQDYSYATLSLVDEDELEESLAITNMIEKSHGMYRDDLLAIGQRFSHLIQGMEFKSETSPPSPNNICHAFEQAIEKLSIELEIKLIIYKLFDKFVVSQLGNMYHEINEMFVNAGILPTIKLKSPIKSQGQTAKPKPTEAAPQSQVKPAVPPESIPSSQETGAASFDSLRQMLSMQRGQTGDSSVSQDGVAVGGGGGPGYVTVDVLAGLTDLQGDFLGNVSNEMQHASVEEIKNNLLSALSKRSGDDSGKRIESDESDVIDIVSMMFEFILEDKSLSDRIRAEIARLQIPIIKVAIIDKQFFNHQAHPARLLLNELAYAGGSRDSMDSNNDDVIFKKIEYVVNRVLTEFQTNMDIFSELLEEFKQFIDTELQSNKVSEKRLEQTKQKVSDEIENRIKNHKIPKLIYDFLISHWKDVLNAVGMRSGCTGQAWTACLDVIDDLIWSVQPKLMASERQELTRSIPKLIKRLKEGLKFISANEKVVATFLDQLGTLHLKCLKGGDDLVNKKDPLDEIDAMLQNLEDGDDSGNPFAADLPAGDFEYFAGTDDFTMIKLTPEVKRSKQYPIVRDMAMGTWVEFIDEEKSRRGKLTWKCDFTGDYTFVDRRYRLVADISTSDLVRRLEKNTAVVVTDVPLLDKAIDAVISTMSKCLQGANKLVSSTSSASS